MPIPELSFHYLGFVYDENATNLDPTEFAEPQIFTAATSQSPAGSYDVNATAGYAANYHFIYHNAQLVVGATAQHITEFEVDPEAIYGDAPLPLFSSTSSGLPVEYSRSNPDVLEADPYTHLRAPETREDLVCRLLLEKTNST